MTHTPETADIAGLVGFDATDMDMIRSGDMLGPALGLRAATALQSLSARATTAEAEAKAMREALEPFALAAADIDDDVLDSSEMWEHPASMSVTAGDFRRAALAREGK